MKSFNAYRFAKKVTVATLLVCIVGVASYYSYDAFLNFILPDQAQPQDIDPLDEAGNAIDATPTDSVYSSIFREAQIKTEASVSDVQKSKTLDTIKPNESLSDARKQQIMNEISGGKR